jgi:hypothetical protein
MSALRVGNASGFYGDRFAAWREMLDGGDLDVLTGDYLPSASPSAYAPAPTWWLPAG